jgi:phosphate transport system ATP-binding protein
VSDQYYLYRSARAQAKHGEEVAVITENEAGKSIRVRNLLVGFSGRPALEVEKLDVFENELTVLLGPSGSGKTTFLRGVNRLNECFPGCSTKGEIKVFLGGKWTDVHSPRTSPDKLRQKVGMVFQTPNVLPMSIERNIALPLKLARGKKGAEAKKVLREVLRETELWDEVRDRLGTNAGTLSGGQQQRLCLARTMALRPEILLLDEPTSSLDFKATARIEELLLRLKRHYTLVVVSHSLGQAKRLADRLVVFREGGIVQSLAREEISDGNNFEAIIEDIF